jgi:CcmD family protein
MSPFDDLWVTLLGKASMDFVIYAYMLIWAVFFGYVFLMGRKLSKLEKDLASLKK